MMSMLQTLLFLALYHPIRIHSFLLPTTPAISTKRPTPTSTALSVWWFGGTPTASETLDGSECELVAVRIDRTSPNSRRISGDIVVEAPLDDVWAILTDYDNLSSHVPNLVASKRIRGDTSGSNGDGTYECRLYQRGAQKIVGFEFGADVTMDMREEIVLDKSKSTTTTTSRQHNEQQHEDISLSSNNNYDDAKEVEKRIYFKCVDSQFFSEFDGMWTVTQQRNPYNTGVESTVSYEVEVRPKGPVPVAALEWRIREDVPTNLRAVKRAALEVGWAGVHENGGRRVVKRKRGQRMNIMNNDGQSSGMDGGFADFILDYENETLGAYLE